MAGVPALHDIIMQTALKTIVPIAGICTERQVIINVLQVGFRPSPKAVVPNFKKINPATGIKNLFGPRAIFETVAAEDRRHRRDRRGRSASGSDAARRRCSGRRPQCSPE